VAETRRLRELISATLPELDLPGDEVEVALSGGADSAALAFLAIEAGVAVSAVHVDHRLPASPRMARAAAAVAEHLGVSLDIASVEMADGPSIEEQARNARYSLLAGRAGPIVTGHTRDDSVETMLINLIRGTGPSGLTGIPRFRPPNVYRPMLAVTRSETREMATLAGLPFVDDPMNEDLSLTRNRVRLVMLPLMRELNPQVDAALARTAETLERDRQYLEDRAAEHFGRALPVSAVSTLPRALADRVLHKALEESGIGPTADRIQRMWSVASGECDRQDLAGGHSVVRRGALLVIE
jgi:tRNA(Ile)-lysidine synthase